jgi:plastocyanin
MSRAGSTAVGARTRALLRRFAIFGSVLLLATAPTTIAAANNRPTTIAAVGSFEVRINQSLDVTFRFAPGSVSVKSGSQIRFVNRSGFDEVHTLTIAKRRELPRTIDEIFNCGGPGTACEPAQGHVDENFEPIPGNEVLKDGRPGLNRVGDSLFVGARGSEGARLIARVRAPAGTNLFFLCAVHPWMQGVIRVR